MTLSYNLAYQETILVHPTRHQIFAGKPCNASGGLVSWFVFFSLGGFPCLTGIYDMDVCLREKWVSWELGGWNRWVINLPLKSRSSLRFSRPVIVVTITPWLSKKYSNPRTANYRVRGAKGKDRREISCDKPMLVLGCIFKGDSRNYWYPPPPPSPLLYNIIPVQRRPGRAM